MTVFVIGSRALAALFLSFFLAACDMANAPLAVDSLSFDQIDGWADEHFEDLLPPLQAQCAHLEHLPASQHLGGDLAALPTGTQAGDWSGACTASHGLMSSRDAVRRYFETWFTPYAVRNNARITGYFEPQFDGSLVHDARFSVPIYGRPADLVRTRSADGQSMTGRWVNQKFLEYYTREEIDHGALGAAPRIVAWLASPVDLFFLQIQGSGRIILPNGSTLRLGYDGRNGRNYVPIGRLLVQSGDMQPTDVSMQAIRDWLESHPDRARAVMEQNPNYVFFRRLDGLVASQGAPGAFGVNLTPWRSIAIDRAVLPLGLPVWLQTELPGVETAWHHLTFAQDLGTDIVGAGRADLYTGWGAQAQAIVGSLHGGGRMIVLLPRLPEMRGQSSLASTP